MAKKTSSKSRSDERKTTSSDAEDAIIVPETEEEAKPALPEDVQTSEDDIPADSDTSDLDTAENDDVEEASGPLTEDEPDPETGEDEPAEEADDLVSDDVLDDAAEVEEEVVEASSIPPVSRPAEPEPAPKSGFPLVLGGVLAGAIGFGAAYLLPSGSDQTGPTAAELQQQLEQTAKSQNDQLSALSGSVATLEQSVNAGSDLAEQVAGLSKRMDALESTLQQLEGAVSQNAASGDVSADVENTLNDLRAALQAQKDAVAQLQSDAEAAKDGAANAANATLQRAALSRLMTGLENGTAYADSVADLQGLGVDVPDVLAQNAQTGILSLSDLQQQFPDAARAALAMGRDGSEVTGGYGASLNAFVRKHLGVRSLEPKEGDDLDAVLSRVEAAARDGRLQDALTEMDSLPETARAPLSAWSTAVQTRLAAIAAAETLNDTLN